MKRHINVTIDSISEKYPDYFKANIRSVSNIFFHYRPNCFVTSRNDDLLGYVYLFDNIVIVQCDDCMYQPNSGKEIPKEIAKKYNDKAIDIGIKHYKLELAGEELDRIAEFEELDKNIIEFVEELKQTLLP